MAKGGSRWHITPTSNRKRVYAWPAMQCGGCRCWLALLLFSIILYSSMGFQVSIAPCATTGSEWVYAMSRCDYHLCCMPPFVFYLVLYLLCRAHVWSAYQPDGCNWLNCWYAVHTNNNAFCRFRITLCCLILEQVFNKCVWIHFFGLVLASQKIFRNGEAILINYWEKIELEIC